MKTAHIKSGHKPTVFDEAIKQFRKDGGKIVVKDATKPFYFTIANRHYKLAKRLDQSFCVVAQALTEAATLEDYRFSVGSNITKIFNVNTGVVTRYVTPERLRQGLKLFDETGEWKLPEGLYILSPPSGDELLTINMTAERRSRRNARFMKSKRKQSKGLNSGTGVNKHRNAPISARTITILHGPRQTPG